ncbi:MAG: carboxypeptidase M32 [Bacteroidota bacterium]
MPSALEKLTDRLGRIADLNSSAAVLEWDQETYMPEGAAEARAFQLATLREFAHELLMADETAALIEAAEDETTDDESFSQPLLRVARRDYERSTRIPAPLIANIAAVSARAKEAWKHARAQDDFAVFAPHLDRILELTLEKAEAVGYDDHPYDALLDEFEPDMRTAEVQRVFHALRGDLVPIVEAIRQSGQVDDSFLHQHYDRDLQWQFGMDVIRELGYDFRHGRQDYSAHPFSTAFAISDVRITTRINERYFPTGFFGTLHEMGHALYEQGIDRRFERTPLADGTSLSTHESQSRLWENQIGRSRAFWTRYFPKLKEKFPGALAGVDLDAFYRGVNRVEPSLIRVEADEVTYSLHIMLRFEIETELVTGRMRVQDIPEAWNDRMEDYLGIRPPSQADGALQDIHWSLAAIGYFPTYALGTLISSQMFDAAERDLGDIDAQVERGEYEPLRDWLRNQVHRWGRARSTSEILQQTTGGGLDATPWLTYIRRKYGDIYSEVTQA